MPSIAIGLKIVQGPWGGGNRFARALSEELLSGGWEVYHDLQRQNLDYILLMDPRYESKSTTFRDHEIMAYRKNNPGTIVIHRINECDERKGTQGVNTRIIEANKIADVTVFVSTWLYQHYLNLGMKPSNPRVILNGADENIFSPRPFTKLDFPIKIVTHHWSDAENKGMGIYRLIDEALDQNEFRNKYQFTYVGPLRRENHFKNSRMIEALDGQNLAVELQRHDIYITGSLFEPGGNHQNEGALSGLPLLYRDHASMGEYLRGFGLTYTPETLFSQLESLRINYLFFRKKIEHYPNTVSKAMKEWGRLFIELESYQKSFSGKMQKLFRIKSKRIILERQQGEVLIKKELTYLVDGSGWAIDQVAKGMLGPLEKTRWKFKVNQRPDLQSKIDLLHIGTRSFFLKNSVEFWKPWKTVGLTWYHGDYFTGSDQEKKDFAALIEKEITLKWITTSCNASKQELMKAGIREDKIVIIPIGVDAKAFLPIQAKERTAWRQYYRVPENAFCVGSFQKDGEGWEEGLIPKPVKAPEVFLEAVQIVKERIPNIHVFLTGPARGFVKNGLEKIGVTYTHQFVADYLDIRKCYACLDAYAISSRCEGGPMGFMESWACGIPVVSTKMGMPADYIEEGINGFLRSVGDSQGIAEALIRYYQDPDLRVMISKKGRESVWQVDWEMVSKLYKEIILDSEE